MEYDFKKKCSVEAIRSRFDNDVERFSNLDTAQVSTIDAPLAMELITQAAFSATKPIKQILDIGCGAGNNTLELLQLNPDIECYLLDLSKPMLDRALIRVSKESSKEVHLIHDDFRNTEFDSDFFDVILGAAVFHHLREDADWEQTFQKLYQICDQEEVFGLVI